MNFQLTDGSWDMGGVVFKGEGTVWNGSEYVPFTPYSNSTQIVGTWPYYQDRSQSFLDVQDAILDKIGAAIDDNDIERAKELLGLAKQLKELK